MALQAGAGHPEARRSRCSRPACCRATSTSARRTTSRRQTTNLLVSEQSVKTQEQRIKQERPTSTARKYDLNKVRVVSPIDGIVTRRNIEEGETAVVGTMNNAGTVLLTDRRPVGDRDGDRGRRDRHPVHQDRPAGEGRRSTRFRTRRSRARSPKSATARFRRPARPRPAARRTSRSWSRSTARCRTCGPASPARP